MSLRGPATQDLHNERAKRASLMGQDGTEGLDGEQKCPLIFFIICEYIDKVYIYLYTKKKLSQTFL